mgnify:CR=1 FL=1
MPILGHKISLTRYMEIRKKYMERLKKPESWLWHLMGFIIPSLVIFGNVKGGFWVSSGLITALVIFPIIEKFIGEDKSKREIRKNGFPFEVILIVHALLMIPVIISICYRGMLDGNILTTWVASISTGITSGISGIIVAHELGHKKRYSIRWYIGRMLLFLVMYSHFTTEHNFTHHRYVGTKKDSATAPKGRGFWVHLFQTIPNQFKSAWEININQSKYLIFNVMFRDMIIQLGLCVGIYLIFGLWAIAAFLVQSLFSIYLLEYINYIRHYGLERKLGEKETKMHSWQTKMRLSRWTLLELSLHPSHHMKATLPFWQLQPYENVNELPNGYYGVFWAAMFPFIWKARIDPLIKN